MKRYREAELTHGRVSMLAVIGFLVGEYIEGSSFLWNAQVTGPAISHLSQVPPAFWILLTVGIGASESKRLDIGWVDPAETPVSQPGLLRSDYTPGDIGFDPLGLKPSDPEELKILQTKELQSTYIFGFDVDVDVDVDVHIDDDDDDGVDDDMG